MTKDARPKANEAAHVEPVVATDLGRVIRTHAGYVWRVLRSLGVHESDLDDLSQEVFITVHRRLPDFEGRSSVKTWIYGIALRLASDYRKRAHRRHEVITSVPPEQQEASSSQESSLERKQAWQLVQRALEGLSEEHRQSFVLYEIEGLTLREVAEILDCPLQTAYSRVLSARERVQSAIGSQDDSEESP